MHLAMPLILLRLWLRGRIEPGYRRFIGERFGGVDQGRQSRDAADSAIWVHAVSVGEVRAAMPLIAALRAVWPEARVVLTCMTPTGRRTALDLFTSNVTVCYLPYDLPWALGRFLTRWRPMMLVIMETELWPNLLASCAKRNVPAFLANARLSERSRLGYAKIAPLRALAAAAFGQFHTVMAQSDADAMRLKSLGARQVVVTGNLKFDLNVVADAVNLGEQWRTPFAEAGRQVVLLASTREHEEMALVDAYRQVFCETLSVTSPAHATRPLLVVVPRHPSRFDDVTTRIAHTGLTIARRSSSAPPPTDIDVWLGDSMGELQAYYAMCDLAIIGGSFQPLGGHNLIEAAALGKPAIMGPSTFNFADAVRLALAAEAMQSVEDASAALAAAKTLLADLPTLHRMGDNALRFAHAHRGATAKTVAIIQGAVNEIG
jgi:3-deoxy-D-manno-octulosonic-acid transferase